MAFTFQKLALPEVLVIKPRIFGDDRGFFMETYKASEFQKAGIRENFVQDNYSRSTKDVLRGLHYQVDPYSQGKLVQCIRGKIFDVAVDIRKTSPRFSRWVAQELCGDNRDLLYIPPGFAHGFVVLSESAEVLYKCTREYSPGSERGIMWNDVDLAIDWPVENPILSEKDRKNPPFQQIQFSCSL